MTGRHRNLDPLRVPRVGSKLRRAYDALLGGGWVAASMIAEHALEDLRNYYNCEIESRPGPHGSRMLGRWDGPYFVPLERLSAPEAA